MSDTDDIMAQVNDLVEETLHEVGQECAEDLRDSLGVAGSAKDRSAPGDYPYRQSGRLRDSVDHQVTRDGEDRIGLTVTTDTEYDEFLNHGTDRMAARPFQELHERKWGPRIEGALQDAADGQRTAQTQTQAAGV